MSPDVFATVGTDHHPFDRLVAWLDAWLAGRDGRTCLVQTGTSAPPRRAEGREYLSYHEMEEGMRGATAVVTHGGPGSIMLAAELGKKPIVVPRERVRGEHVDDHQVLFARRLAAESQVELAETEERLHELLDRALAEGGLPAAAREGARPEEAVRRFAELVDGLVAVDRDEVTVLYIGGSGRSGSTLLNLMLGQLPGFFSGGELRFVWRRGLAENRLCGCGARFRECDFWRRVGEEAFGGWDEVDLDEVLALERAVDRHRFIPFLLAPRLSGRFARRLERYGELLAALYRGIGAVSGAPVVVDATKDAQYAFLLRRVRGVRVRVIHLVRDSRGVSFSWSKPVRATEAEAPVASLDRYRPSGSALRWASENLLFHALGALRVPRAFMRYERLVRDPRAELPAALARLGFDPPAGELGFVHDGLLDLTPQHTVAGNPVRFAQGPLALEVDDEWRTRMTPRERRLVLLLTWPLLLRYGYLRT